MNNNPHSMQAAKKEKLDLRRHAPLSPGQYEVNDRHPHKNRDGDRECRHCILERQRGCPPEADEFSEGLQVIQIEGQGHLRVDYADSS